MIFNLSIIEIFFLRGVKRAMLCSHSPNDVPPVPQRNVSIAAERVAVRPSIKRAIDFIPI